jgi:hypothetical protein
MFTQLTEISGTWKLTQKCAHMYSNNECVQLGVLHVCDAVITIDEQHIHNDTVDDVDNQIDGNHTTVIDPDAEWVRCYLFIFIYAFRPPKSVNMCVQQLATQIKQIKHV